MKDLGKSFVSSFSPSYSKHEHQCGVCIRSYCVVDRLTPRTCEEEKQVVSISRCQRNLPQSIPSPVLPLHSRVLTSSLIKRQTLRLETAATSDSSSSSSSSSSSAYSSNGTTSSTLSNASGSSRDHTASSAVDELYVMWMGAGESNGTFGMSAVATSHYPDGPFSMRRTLYPDGNETHDQTVYIGAVGLPHATHGRRRIRTTVLLSVRKD